MAILPEDIRDIENADIRQQIQIIHEYIKYMREMIEFWASNAGRGVGQIAEATQKMIDASKTFTQSDWEQEDETADDFIKNKPVIPEGATVDTELSPTSTNPVQNKVISIALENKANNSDIPTKVSDLQNDTGFISTETDPTVPTWAKAATKPSYTATEVGALPANTSIPSKTSDLTNDSGFITTETDPTVPAWAKASTKPSYTASEVGAVPTTRKVNNKALNEDISLTASDISDIGAMGLLNYAEVTAIDDNKVLQLQDGSDNLFLKPARITKSVSASSSPITFSLSRGTWLITTVQYAASATTAFGLYLATCRPDLATQRSVIKAITTPTNVTVTLAHDGTVTVTTTLNNISVTAIPISIF